MIYDFDSCPERRGTKCEKWDRYPADVLPLWVADMDFVSPEPVVRALRERVAHGVFGYGAEPRELRDLIVARMAERYAWQIQRDDIVFTPGVIRGFNLACHTVGTPDGGVLVQPPVYPPMLRAAGYAGMIWQEAQLARAADGSYSIDWNVFDSAITEQTRVFILCNPHNPVGRVFRRDELARMAEKCLQRGVVICSDEIHCDLVYPGYRHIPIASLDPEIARNTITLMAPSKTFNIAGLDCAFAIIQNEEFRKRYKHAARGLMGGINIMGFVGAVAAYRNGQEWLTQALAYLESNRDYVYAFVEKEMPGITVTKLEATYLAWLDCRAVGIAHPYEFFLQNARVALNDGKIFGSGGEGFVRLNFGCPRSILDEALERMNNALIKKS
jgi:cystathionine beta-lyase